MPVYTVHAPGAGGADLRSTDRFVFVRDGFRFWAILFADIVVALLMGFEAASLQRWTLSRNRWPQLDVVIADDEEAAERRFFDRWARKQHGIVNDQQATDRGAPPPTRDAQGLPFSRPPQAPGSGIIGLFPEPGGPR